MSTIKDVAERAGVSTATVSYVINGKAESRGIAPATRQRVMDAVAQLGYRPSQAARRLRSTPAKPVFVLFWPLDSRASWLGMFLAAFQRAIVETEADCELLIQTYRNGEIQSAYEGANSNAYSGLINALAQAQQLRSEAQAKAEQENAAELAKLEADKAAAAEKLSGEGVSGNYRMC